jgi:two-component system sensor histidine kinase DesK
VGPKEADGDNELRWSGHRELVGKASSLIWLVFLIIPLASLTSEHGASVVHLVVTVGAVVVFAALFCTLVLLPDERCNSIPRPVLLVVVMAMWGLTIFLVFFDRPVWDYEFIFSVFPSVHLLGRRRLAVAGIAVGAIVVGVVAGLDYVDVALVGLLCVGTGVSGYGVSRLIEANDALRRAHTDQARAAVAEERLRFARDLHDLLGHSLSVISLKTEVAGRLLGADPGRAQQEITEIQEIARRALREVREAVGGYRLATVAVELAGARTALAAAGIKWQEDITTVDLPGEVEAALAWTLREGVTNVVRHARATSCDLHLHVVEKQVMVTVNDDGDGADVTGAGAVVYGHGLGGLGERVAAIAGRLDAGPRPDGGFSLQVSVPLGAS